MRGHTECWPGTKSHDFWTSAADFVLQCNPNSNRSSGMLFGAVECCVVIFLIT